MKLFRTVDPKGDRGEYQAFIYLEEIGLGSGAISLRNWFTGSEGGASGSQGHDRGGVS